MDVYRHNVAVIGTTASCIGPWSGCTGFILISQNSMKGKKEKRKTVITPYWLLNKIGRD